MRSKSPSGHRRPIGGEGVCSFLPGLSIHSPEKCKFLISVQEGGEKFRYHTWRFHKDTQGCAVGQKAGHGNSDCSGCAGWIRGVSSAVFRPSDDETGDRHQQFRLHGSLASWCSGFVCPPVRHRHCLRHGCSRSRFAVRSGRGCRSQRGRYRFRYRQNFAEVGWKGKLREPS